MGIINKKETRANIFIFLVYKSLSFKLNLQGGDDMYDYNAIILLCVITMQSFY